jgi:hypothetical protein
MRFRSTLTSMVALTALVTAVAAVATGNPIPRWAGSWADRNHIWEERTAEGNTRENLCDAYLCGTEDGAETWHPVFRSRDAGALHFVRTSQVAGVIRIGMVDQTSDPYWTRDGGRHWYRTTRIGGRLTGASFQLAGSGPYLYWNRSGELLYRVVPWPPRIAPQCSGEWRLDLTAGGTPPPGSWGAICFGPAEDAGMRNIVARRLTGHSFSGDMVSVPSGIESLPYPIERRRPRLFVLQDGRARRVRLPRPPVWRKTLGLNHYRLHRLAWPQIGVSASALGRNGPYPIDTIGCVIWHSRNGGRTWRVRTVPFGSAPFPYCK